MKPLFLFNKWRGINDRVSPRDLPDNSLVECKDFEFDYTLGNLVLSKGWSKLINYDLGGFARGLIEFAILKGENIVKYLMTMIESNILRYWYYDSGWSSVQSLNGGDINSDFNEFHPIFANNSITSGVGNGVSNIPFWFGYLKYKRFYNYDTSVFDEEIDGMYFSQEELVQPYLLESFDVFRSLYGSDSVVESGIASGLQGTLGANKTYWITFSFLYEGGQESSLPMTTKAMRGGFYIYNPHGVGGSRRIYQTVFTKYFDIPTDVSDEDNYICFVLGVSKNLINGDSYYKKIRGINIYMKNATDGHNWRYIRTVYLDETKVATRVYNSDTELNLSGYEKWDDFGNYYKYVPNQDPGAPYRIYISATEYSNGIDVEDQLGYSPTPQTMPNYKYSAIFKAVKYIGNALYPEYYYDTATGKYYIQKEYNLSDLLTNIVHFSVPNQFNLIPKNNFIKIEEPVSALGSTDNYLLIFSENTCHVYNSNQQKVSEWKGCGCISHDAIAYYNGICFYPGKDNIFMFDRYYPQDISSMKIMAAYKDISIESKRLATGTINYAKKEYILSIFGNATFIYNITTGEWRMKNKNLVAVTNRIDSDVIGINYGGEQYIITFEDTYEYIDEVYTAWALTKKMTGLQADNLVKSLLLGYVCYKSSDSLTIEILIDGVVAQTIVLDAQTNMKSVQFGCGGVNGENVQLKISITTSATTEFGEVDFIKLWGDVHDIQGG
jgi:hypothetical protein